MEKFLSPSKPQRFEIEIKRSRFITTVASVSDKSQVSAFVQSLRNEFADANHHCWAAIAGQPDDMFAQNQSDDGEPKGTAGKPILNVLQHSGLGNIVVVVTRYFGGIKLGAGGLVRAYTQSASEALKQLDTVECHIREKMIVQLPYALLDTLEHWLQSSTIGLGEKRYAESVELTLFVPATQIEPLMDKLNSLGGGLENNLDPTSISIRRA